MLMKNGVSPLSLRERARVRGVVHQLLELSPLILTFSRREKGS